ncbi:MAG: hypothetical protein MUE38_04865 [Flavihumibacter sp.]|jgi:hypothetical protein|nr:hypothetical protein [Flavihumibacter sp.]
MNRSLRRGREAGTKEKGGGRREEWKMEEWKMEEWKMGGKGGQRRREARKEGRVGKMETYVWA